MFAIPNTDTILGVGNTPLLSGSVVPVGTSVPFNPAQLTFALLGKQRLARRLSDIGKVVYPLDASDPSVSLWTRTSFGASQNNAWTPGSYTVTYGGTTLSGYRHVTTGQVSAPFAHAELTVTFTGTAGTEHSIAVGLFNAAGTQWLAAKFDRKAGTHGRVSLVANTGAGEAAVGATYDLTADPAAGSVLEFNLNGPTATVYFGGQFMMSRYINSSFEVRTPSVLAALFFGFYTQSDGSGNTVQLTGDFKTGYFGFLGISDVRFVRDVWGNAYQDPQGLVYFTADLAGFGAADTAQNAPESWRNQHSGVFSIHPPSGLGSIQEVGKLWPKLQDNLLPRYTPPFTIGVPGGNGMIGGSTDFALKFDPRSGAFVTTHLVPFGGTNEFVMYYGSSLSNLMRGINVGFLTSPLPLWDLGDDSSESNNLNADWYEKPDGIVDLWVSKQNGGAPTLHRGTGTPRDPVAQLASLERLSRGSANGYHEGVCVVRIGDLVYPVFTGLDPLLHCYSPTPNGSDITYLGDATLPSAPPTGGAATWPSFFEYRSGGVTSFYALMFQSNDPYQRHLTAGDTLSGVVAWTSGTLCLYKADRTITGYQSPLVNYGI